MKKPSAARVAPYDKLKSAIISGELEPGQPLVETALAEWCRTSRTPIREALRRLDADGLIKRTSSGLAVRKRSPEEILDIYDTRIVLEATAARVAAERRTDHDVQIMRHLIARCEQVSEDDSKRMNEANHQFHRAAWRASHNESLIDLLERLHLHLARYPGTSFEKSGRWEQACREHEQLLDAIEARDSGEAHEIALQHFSEARDIRLGLLADQLVGD